VQCLHCRSNLLVTGRKQVLSYYIPPKLVARDCLDRVAVAGAKKGARGRAVKSQLYFIPFYRLTGHDFRWEETVGKREPGPVVHPLLSGGAFTDTWAPEPASVDLVSLLQSAGKFLIGLLGSAGGDVGRLENQGQGALKSRNSSRPAMAGVPVEAGPLRGGAAYGTCCSPYADESLELRDRYVEKNFNGCHLEGVGLYSLGVRPSVLRLELFRKELLQSLGKIVPANLTPQEAWSRGMKTDKLNPLRYRRVIGQILSVIYFPFWFVEIKRGANTFLAIVDAVSKSIIKLDAPPSLYGVLDRELDSEPPVVGFRPLACPNCGWDLPVAPEHVTFYCSSCERNWQILGSELTEATYRIAATGGKKSREAARYLPFWVLEAHGADDLPARYFLPAFRYRHLKSLSDLAIRISRQQPSYGLATEKASHLQGCYYDREDAAMFAQLTQVGLASKPLERIKALKDKELSVSGATLTWFPFEVQGAYLLDPFTGYSLFQGLLA